MAFWLVKSEEDVYSIDQFRADKSTLWDGVRNYQARNFLKAMKSGDEVLFYHSNAEPLAIVGLGKITKEAAPDPLQFDKKSEYFDPGSTKENPRWFAPELKFVEKFPSIVTLEQMREMTDLADMVLLKRGSRLSVQPVTERQFKAVLKAGRGQ